MYETDLLTGPRDDSLDRTMAESFVRHALELRNVTERGFVSRFAGELAQTMSFVPGMSANEVTRSIFDLHHRHAVAVETVLKRGYRRYAGELAARTLPGSCILRLVAGPDGVVVPAPVADAAQPAAADHRDFARTSQIRLALDLEKERILIEGMPPIEGSASFRLLQILIAQSDSDRGRRLAPENHTFTSGHSLAGALSVSEASVRRCIHRLRRRVADAFLEHAALPLSANALIENRSWKGYRLNPKALILSLEELGRVQGHKPRQVTSHLSGTIQGRTVT